MGDIDSIIRHLEQQVAAANERADMLEHQRCELESALHSSHRHVAHFRECAEAAERERDEAVARGNRYADALAAMVKDADRRELEGDA